MSGADSRNPNDTSTPIGIPNSSSGVALFDDNGTFLGILCVCGQRYTAQEAMTLERCSCGRAHRE